jgi:hypothetical protein
MKQASLPTAQVPARICHNNPPYEGIGDNHSPWSLQLGQAGLIKAFFILVFVYDPSHTKTSVG